MIYRSRHASEEVSMSGYLHAKMADIVGFLVCEFQSGFRKASIGPAGLSMKKPKKKFRDTVPFRSRIILSLRVCTNVFRLYSRLLFSSRRSNFLYTFFQQ
jgi:hypothetical protein